MSVTEKTGCNALSHFFNTLIWSIDGRDALGAFFTKIKSVQSPFAYFLQVIALDLLLCEHLHKKSLVPK